MVLDSAEADAKFPGDLLVGKSGSDAFGDLALAWRQGLKQGQVVAARSGNDDRCADLCTGVKVDGDIGAIGGDARQGLECIPGTRGYRWFAECIDRALEVFYGLVIQHVRTRRGVVPMSSVPLEISNFFMAMQAGKAGADALKDCFAPDAVYQEPFTGEMRTHNGKDEIINAMALGWEQPLPDMTIHIDRVETKDSEILVNWTCKSPGLPGGQGSGLNRFVLEDGLITSLITTLEGQG